MSQISGMAEGDQSTPGGKTPTGRAVLLLAVAVVLGIGILHELDKPVVAENTIAATEQSHESTQQQSQASQQQSPATVITRTPADVKVLVANGVAVNGAAAKITLKLQPVGYNLLKPGNTTQTQTASAVQYVEGYQTEAQAIAIALGLPATSVQTLPSPAMVSDLQGANIVVIVGSDLAASTTTTVASSNNAINGPLSQTSGSGTSSTTTTTLNR